MRRSNPRRHLALILSLAFAVLATGCDVGNEPTKIKRSADMLAAINDGDTQAIKAYLDAGGDPNGAYSGVYAEESRLAKNWTYLMSAASGGQLDIVNLLIAAGANVNAVSEFGRTPLSLAAYEGHADIARALIAAGADVNQERPAPASGKTEIGVLSVPSRKGHLSIVLLLLESGADVDATDSQQKTALVSAAEGGNIDVVNLLLAAGADVNHGAGHRRTESSQWYDGYTPLMAAASYGHADIVTRLLEAGAKVHEMRGDRLTAMNAARNRGHDEVIAVLEANRPMHLALDKEVKASSVLWAGGNPENAVDGDPHTPWASERSDPQWIYVDLGDIYSIERVVLRWHGYASAYEVQVSNDASTWTTVFTEINGNGGLDDLTLPAVSARFVRMHGTQRAKEDYAYTVTEFEVYE
jgi:hypothetical protein